MRRGALVLAATSALTWCAGPAAAAPATHARDGGKGDVLCRFADPRIDEASGIAVAQRTPGVVFVQNDSGDTNRYFAVDLRTCATVVTIRVRGARNVDWEDIATGRDSAGAAVVWLADIGDNDAKRHSVQIYRVGERELPRHRQRGAISSGRAAVWRLRYPDGPTDAESFAVAPGGRGYVVAKSILGVSAVYELPLHATGAKLRTLQRVGTIRFATHGVANPFGLVGELTATGAAFSPNGALFAVRTYASAYVWRVDGRPLTVALRGAPTRIDLPRQPQGEGITFDGDRLLIDSEGRHSAIRAVPLPTRLAGDGSATRRAVDNVTAAASPTQHARTSRSAHRSVGGIVVGVIVLAVIVVTRYLLRRRSRRRFRRDEPDEPRE